MSKRELRIAKETAEKLKNERNIHFLLGWTENEVSVCIESVTFGHPSDNDLLDLHKDDTQAAFRRFPAGIGIIGLYSPCFADEATGKAQRLFDQLLSCDVENCIASSSLVFVHDDLSSSRCLVYDSETETTSAMKITVHDRPALFSDKIRFRTTGKLELEFETSDDIAATLSNLEKACEKVQEKVDSSAAVFQMLDSTLLLRNSNGINDFSHPKLKRDSRCLALESILHDGDSNAQNYQCLEFKLWFKSTGDDAIKHTVSCVPIIHVERRNFNVAIVSLAIDVITYVSRQLPVANLSAIFVNGILSQLNALQSAMVNFYKEKGKFFAPKIYHFRYSKQDPILSLVYPEGLDDPEFESHRRRIHLHLTLPLDQPLFRRVQSVSFPVGSSPSGHLYDVHSGLAIPSTDGQLATVKGSYAYHHYMQDRFDDDGWGCAYRSLQTLISWFRCQGYTSEAIPSHRKIQETLVELGDKPKSFVNSRQWIGSMEVSYCLDKLIGISSKIMFVNSGAELANKARELINHFSVQGTPIMIGGGVYAHTILGVHFNEKTGDTKFLILDPHYTGSEDLKTIQTKAGGVCFCCVESLAAIRKVENLQRQFTKRLPGSLLPRETGLPADLDTEETASDSGWCGWKGPNFWNQTAHYNLCCPQRPSGV